MIAQLHPMGDQGGHRGIDRVCVDCHPRRVRVTLLGPVAVEGSLDGLGPRDRVVLGALAVHPGQTVTAERLADALWREVPPATWPKVVQGCVVRLRKCLGADAIETTARGYRLLVGDDEVDARRFQRQVVEGRELMTLREWDRAAYVLTQALELWQGQALVDLEGWEPADREATRLEQLRHDAEELRVEAALRVGRYRDVQAEIGALVADEPLREQRWGLLAWAQYQAGRQGEALATIQRARSVLAAELGLDAGPDLAALELAILQQDPSLLPDVELEASPADRRISDSCPTTSMTRMGSSGATPRSLDAGLRSPGRVSSPFWGLRAAASPRSCGPESQPGSAGTATTYAS